MSDRNRNLRQIVFNQKMKVRMMIQVMKLVKSSNNKILRSKSNIGLQGLSRWKNYNKSNRINSNQINMQLFMNKNK